MVDKVPHWHSSQQEKCFIHRVLAWSDYFICFMDTNNYKRRPHNIVIIKDVVIWYLSRSGARQAYLGLYLLPAVLVSTEHHSYSSFLFIWPPFALCPWMASTLLLSFFFYFFHTNCITTTELFHNTNKIPWIRLNSQGWTSTNFVDSDFSQWIEFHELQGIVTFSFFPGVVQYLGKIAKSTPSGNKRIHSN